jgi:hypothetical protein
MMATPVMFPPGRARFETNPAAIGSPAGAMTIGMVCVALLAALTARALVQTITLGHRIEHALKVSWRRSDHPQDLGGRRLLLQGLAQVPIPILKLLEQRTFSIAMTAWSAKV